MTPLLCALAALLVHEGFHLLAGHVFFQEGIRLFFLPWGFRAVWIKFNPEKWVQCLICASGPAGNLFAAGIFAALQGRDVYFHDFIRANLVIGLFNLIPLYPMDGGNILLVLLYSRVGTKRTIRMMQRFGSIIRVLLLLIGLYLTMRFKNPSLFITIALLPGIQSVKRSVNRLNLDALIRRKERILKKKAYPVRHILVLKEISLGEALLLLDYDQYHILHVADQQLQVLCQVTEQQLINAMMCQTAGKTLEEAFGL
ncbi:MAG: Zn-dependent protease [Thermoclostridium sp.]|nr:Zn-dependent protease [Thermoclostridium sp.]